MTLQTQEVEITLLKKHPKNYREHPEDQIAHLIESIEKNGIYRNIVVAKDNVILAGHGIYLALQKMGYEKVPIIKLDIDSESPQALKILVGDNEISHLTSSDDRALTELLKGIKETDIAGLLGTGYDEMMLANLLMITRPENEIKDFDAAAEWVGLPDFESAKIPHKLIISFDKYEELQQFCNEILQIKVSQASKITDKTISVWWPIRPKDDSASLKITG